MCKVRRSRGVLNAPFLPLDSNTANLFGFARHGRGKWKMRPIKIRGSQRDDDVDGGNDCDDGIFMFFVRHFFCSLVP